MPPGKSRNLEIHREGPGAYVTQEPGTNNFFCFAIPTPAMINEKNVILGGTAWIDVTIEDNAEIDRIDIWHGDENLMNFGNKKEMNPFKEIRSYKGGMRQRIDLNGIPAKSVKLGMAMFIRVNFLTGARSRVIFHGVGMRFDMV